MIKGEPALYKYSTDRLKERKVACRKRLMEGRELVVRK